MIPRKKNIINKTIKKKFSDSNNFKYKFNYG